MRVEIRSTDVKSEEIRPSQRVGAKQFNPFMKYTQEAYAVTVGPNGQPDPYPTRFRLVLGKAEAVLASGVYTVADGSFYVDRNANLVLGRLVLEVVKGATLVKAA